MREMWYQKQREDDQIQYILEDEYGNELASKLFDDTSDMHLADRVWYHQMYVLKWFNEQRKILNRVLRGLWVHKPSQGKIQLAG